MSPTPPTLNPSQTVERIREIIVGRHLERLEGRVARLESQPAAAAVAKPPPPGDIFEDRLLITEARVEALQDHVHRIEGLREETERLGAMHKQEVQRLAMQISEIARAKAENSEVRAVENLERKLGSWLTEWQKTLQMRLETRDRDLAEKVRIELAAMREGIEKRFAELESRVPVNVEDRFNRIAAAARALAESAGSYSTQTSPKP
jgi:chaperonin cofactor prefoldin